MKAQEASVASSTLGTNICHWKEFVDPAARHSEANKQARLVERKVCLISDAGNWAESQLPASLADKQGLTALIDRWGGGCYMQKQHSHL